MQAAKTDRKVKNKRDEDTLASLSLATLAEEKPGQEGSMMSSALVPVSWQARVTWPLGLQIPKCLFRPVQTHVYAHFFISSFLGKECGRQAVCPVFETEQLVASFANRHVVYLKYKNACISG